MSATGRSDVRVENDFYETPEWVTRSLLPLLPWERELGEGVILDPCAGSGAILNVLRNHYTGKGLSFVGADIVERPGIDIVRDMLSPEPWPKASLIVTNPPYGLAEEFIRRALQTRASFVAMLLRVNFLGSQERIAFHREFPSDVNVLPKRPSFCAVVKCGSGRSSDCKWRVVLPLKAERPKTCPACDFPKVTVVTSDATEYAWFTWNPFSSGGRWRILDVPSKEERELAK